MKSVMQHKFSQVPSVDIPRSSFDRSHGVKTTFNSGYLIPIFADEVLPGDTFNCRTSGFVRLATPLFPVMDNMFLDTFYFFVPWRLVWDNFKKAMGEQKNPGDSVDYLAPILDLTSTPIAANTLYDYFGAPVGISGANLKIVNGLGRSYNLIYNTWFRDQNLQNSVVVDTDDGPDTLSDYVLLRRGKRHDYFTSCLPWPQKGTAVDLPIGTSAPVLSDGSQPTFNAIAGSFAAPFPGIDVTVAAGFATSNTSSVAHAGALAQTAAKFANTGLYADLASATAATINTFRQALQVQALYERDARGGTRYTEIIFSHFKVKSPDERLQRPEYLGGGEAAINIHPVAATADLASAGGDPTLLNTGGLRAFGTAAFKGHGFTKSFTEHGFVIGLASVRADITYQQGLNRMFSRRSKLDFYWPVLAPIGEQAVLSKEIYCDASANDEDVWGYQERYGEYRYKPSIVTGEMRSSFAQSLDSWHLALDFPSRPLLNSTFIVDNPPISRVVQDTADPQLIGDFYHQLITARPMPLYGVPGSLLRF